jgi:hypothetical protein
MAALVATIDYVNIEFLKDTLFWMMVLVYFDIFAFTYRSTLVFYLLQWSHFGFYI